MYGLRPYYAVTLSQMPNVGKLRRVSETNISMFLLLARGVNKPWTKTMCCPRRAKLEAVLIRRIARGSCSSQTNNRHACAIEQHVAVLNCWQHVVPLANDRVSAECIAGLCHSCPGLCHFCQHEPQRFLDNCWTQSLWKYAPLGKLLYQASRAPIHTRVAFLMYAHLMIVLQKCSQVWSTPSFVTCNTTIVIVITPLYMK